MAESLLSVGIDIGTTTTQIIFSRLVIENTRAFGMNPKFEIVSKEIIHWGKIHFTPLLSNSEIDASVIRNIIASEYADAGFAPSDISTGAVIITGESSRKRNAKKITHEIAEFAGDFVVASAGPELDSILAGKGSGCQKLSREKSRLIANLDIGGGTTNICFFQNGRVVDTTCLEIGGRQIRVDNGRVTYISNKLQALLDNENISLELGDELSIEKASYITSFMADVLCEAVGLKEQTAKVDMLTTNNKSTVAESIDFFSFSGGVADCINKNYTDFEFNDIGVLLANAIKNSLFFAEGKSLTSEYTIGATVIGAGNFSLELSGSTIEYQNCNFPIKSIPIVKIDFANDAEIEVFDKKLKNKLHNFIKANDDIKLPAIAFQGEKNPSYKQIVEIANRMKEVIDGIYKPNDVLVVVIENDMAKALGKVFKRVAVGQSFIFIDGIRCSSFNFIDIGSPVANGNAVPVVIKSLLFNS